MKLRWRVPGPTGAAQESLFTEPRRGSASDPAELRTRGARLLLSFLWIQAAGFVVYLVVSTWVEPSAFLRYGSQTAFGWSVIVLLAFVLRHAHDGLEEVIVYGMTWLLLLSGVRVAVAHGAGAGDARNLSRTTHIPRQIWALLWLAGTLLAVVAGGKWLVLRS